MGKSGSMIWWAGAAALAAISATITVESLWPSPPAHAAISVEMPRPPDVQAPALALATVELDQPDVPAPLAGLTSPEPVIVVTEASDQTPDGLRSSVQEPVLIGQMLLPGALTPQKPLADEMVRRETVARDPSLSRIAVLPPPRPSFREASLPSGPASADRQIVEIRSRDSGSAWPEPAAAAFSFVSLSPPARTPMLDFPGRPQNTLQAGLASWYGPGFHGRRTASGERFDQNALTAAHRSLPFGTKVRVIDEKTGRSIVVRINDRGPFAHGRIIDLSKGSAQALGMSGMSRVKIVSAE